MGSRGFETDIVENFSLGVISSVLADRLPDGAVPSVINGQFYNVGPNISVFGTRKGCEVQNPENPGDGQILSLYFLNGVSDDFILTVVDMGAAGGLFVLDDDELTEIDDGLFTETDNPFSWQTANGFAFVTNGAEQFKTDGEDVFNFGIGEPSAAHWSVAAVAGGSNLPAGVYNLVVSYYNADSGHEGPQSEPESVTITAGQKIRVTLPTALNIDDAQVTHVKIYIEQEGVRNDFFLGVAGATPAIDSNNEGWDVGTTTVDFDILQSALDVFVVLSPGVNNNYPPPTDTICLANHKSRMFAATATDIYWSEVDKPEAFNTTDNNLTVGEDDGERITAIAELGDALLVFKQNATYALIGSTPESWEIILVDKTVGCVGLTSIASVDNKLTFMSLRGPQMMLSAESGVKDITSQLIGDLFTEENVDSDDLEDSVVVPHPTDKYVAWAVKDIDSSVNNKLIPFDYKLQRWMSKEWRMVDVSACAVVTDSEGRQWPFVGDYSGYIYKLGVTDNDGIPPGVTTSGRFQSAETATVIVPSAGWTADELIGRYVYLWLTASGVRTAMRHKITDNTTDTLTVSPNIEFDMLNGEYSLGGILFDFRSAFRNGGGPFYRKNIEFLFLELASDTDAVECDVEVYKNMDDETPILQRTIVVGAAAEFDTAIFDVDVFAAPGVEQIRIPVRNIGYNWQTRVIQLSQGERLSVYRNAMQWQTKTKKTGR